MCHTERVLFGDIENALCLLDEQGFQVKELEATPSTFGSLVKELQAMGASGVAISFCGDDPPWITLSHYGRLVRITMKPLLKLSLDLPPKVPMPGEPPADG